MRNQRSARKMRASNKALAEQAARLRVAPIIATPEEPDQSGGVGGGGGGGDDGAGSGEGGAGSGGGDSGAGGGWPSGGGNWPPNDGSGGGGWRGRCELSGADWWNDYYSLPLRQLLSKMLRRMATPTTPEHLGDGGGGGGGGRGRAGGGKGGAGSGGDDAGTGGGWLSGGGSWSPNDRSVSSNGSSGSRGGCGTGGAEWWDDSGTFRDASAGAPRAYCWWACALILAAVASYTPAATPSCVHERPRHLSHQAATATPAAARWPDLCRSPPRWATRRPPRGHALLGGGCGGGGAIVGRGDAYKVPSSVQAAC